jgi:hypothetical protein
MTQSKKRPRERQSWLNLQKEKRVLVGVFSISSGLGLYMGGAWRYLCEKLE